MSSGPSNLFDLATNLLSAVVAAFADAGVTLPSRQYVTAVFPVGVCDTVAVSWDQIVSGWPGMQTAPQALTHASTKYVMLTVHIYRCLDAVIQASGAEPTVLELEADALQIMTDANVLWTGVQKAKYVGWFADYTTAMELGPLVPVAAEGGMSGCVMTVQVELT